MSPSRCRQHSYTFLNMASNKSPTSCVRAFVAASTFAFSTIHCSCCILRARSSSPAVLLAAGVAALVRLGVDTTDGAAQALLLPRLEWLEWREVLCGSLLLLPLVVV